jgi:hypothetical protein
MNERIKDLAKQAGYYLYDLTEAHECKTVETDSKDEWITLEKFAELLVFECVNAVMDGTKEGDHYAQCIEQHFDNGQGGILHFGVEE